MPYVVIRFMVSDMVVSVGLGWVWVWVGFTGRAGLKGHSGSREMLDYIIEAMGQQRGGQKKHITTKCVYLDRFDRTHLLQLGLKTH